MASRQIDAKEMCSSCNAKIHEADTIQCYDCKTMYHAVCTEGNTPYCTNKSFLSSFKKIKTGNFLFVCDLCLTKKENKEASTINDQISTLTETVSSLVREFSTFKAESIARSGITTLEADKEKPWSKLNVLLR